MFNVHQGARFVPTDCDAAKGTAPSGKQYPLVSVSTSHSEDGSFNVSIANPSLDGKQTVELEFDTLKPSTVKAEILVSSKISDYNDFGSKDVVKPAAFKDFKVKGNKISMTLPAASIVVLNAK